MHSSFQRIQNVFGYFTSVVFAVAVAVALSVVLSPQNPSASLELKNVKVAKGRPFYYSTKREEYAHITFDLTADLSSLFNWNTKQVFLWIAASYPSSDPTTIPPSDVVVWDAVIPSIHAPLHPNTYLHPKPPSKSATQAKQSKQSKKNLSRGKAYPEGASPGILRLQGQKPKYQVTDLTGKMAERANATLSLHWNVQPWVGALTWTNRNPYFWGKWQPLKGGVTPPFSFPPIKPTETKKEELKTETGAERNRGSPA